MNLTGDQEQLPVKNVFLDLPKESHHFQQHLAGVSGKVFKKLNTKQQMFGSHLKTRLATTKSSGVKPIKKKNTDPMLLVREFRFIRIKYIHEPLR